MAKLKSFEDYIADIDSAEEIEKDMMDMGEPEEAGDGEEVQSQEQEMGSEEAEDEVEGEEAGEEVEDMEGPESEGEQDMEINGEPVDTEPEDKSDEIEDEMEDPEETDMEIEESEEVDSSEEEVEEGDKEEVAKALVADMMKEMFEACKEEAKAWESDMHDEHTIEAYMCENAALAAALATQALKEMKEDMTLEMYEAACESLKESYSKKIDEMKETLNAEGEEEGEKFEVES